MVCISVYGQKKESTFIKAINPDHAEITHDELKYITTVLSKYVSLRDIIVKKDSLIVLYENSLGLKDSIIVKKDFTIELLEEEIERLQPSIFEKMPFWAWLLLGLTGGAVLGK